MTADGQPEPTPACGDARTRPWLPRERRITLSVLLRPGSRGLDEELDHRFSDDPWAYLSRREFARRYRAAAGDVDRVERFAAARGLEVVAADRVRRTVVLSGGADEVRRTFGIRPALAPGGDDASVLSADEVPRRLRSCVIAILASSPVTATGPAQLGGQAWRDEPPGPVPGADLSRCIRSARDVAEFYGMPEPLTGRGQTIGVIAPGGGFAAEDLRRHRGSGRRRGIDLRAVSVDGAHNARMTAPRPHVVETTADIQLAASAAPGARIVVYFTRNDERGLVDVLSSAVHDADRHPDVLAISWGRAEQGWSRVALHAVHQVLLEAAALGITVCAAAGNDGWRGRMIDDRPHVEFPASDPLVLACGGTRGVVRDQRLIGEQPWAEDGGTPGSSGYGLSAVWGPDFFRPGQEGRPGRAVPDVCAIAGQYLIRVGGHDVAFLGTSAAAQLWAGLVACLNEAAGRPLGLLTGKIGQVGQVDLGSCFRTAKLGLICDRLRDSLPPVIKNP